jgi:hypothetical protein
MYDSLSLRERLLPSRATPGLWQGIDGYGLAAVRKKLLCAYFYY